MNEKLNSKDTSLDKETLDAIESEISELTIKLSEAKQTRNQLTAKKEIDFKISTIHKDRAPIIILKAQKIDREKSYKAFEEEWQTSVAENKEVLLKLK